MAYEYLVHLVVDVVVIFFRIVAQALEAKLLVDKRPGAECQYNYQEPFLFQPQASTYRDILYAVHG